MSVIYGRIGTPQFYVADSPEPSTPIGWAVMQGFPPEGNPSNFAFYAYWAKADGSWQYVQIPAPPKPIVWYDNKLMVDNGDYTFSPVSPLALPARRRLLLSTTLGANGVAVVDLTQYGFTSPPSIYQVIGKNAAAQVVFPRFSAVSATSVTVTGERTRATILLNNTPFEPAPAGEVVSFWVHEN